MDWLSFFSAELQSYSKRIFEILFQSVGSSLPAHFWPAVLKQMSAAAMQGVE